MQHARLIVCESEPFLAVALRRELTQQELANDLRVYAVMTIEHCRDELMLRPASFIAVQLTPENIEDVYRFVNDVRDGFCGARVVVLADSKTESLGAGLREAGAVYVASSIRGSLQIATLARRHFATIEQPRWSLRESVMARLPWSD